jgi:hypothetical protein
MDLRTARRGRGFRNLVARTWYVSRRLVAHCRARDLSQAASHLCAAKRKVEQRVFPVSSRPR